MSFSLILLISRDAIYRLDQPIRSRHRSPPSTFDSESALPEVDDLLQKLAQWKACTPVLPPGRSGVPMQSKAAQDMEYHNCVQMLLRPVISAHFSSPRYIGMCFDSAASQCEIQWQNLKSSTKQYRLSNWALYRLFLSGLTLLHLASSPTTVPLIDSDRASNALNKCRDSLGVFIRHLPAMKAYEDTFKDLVNAWQSKGRVSADTIHSARMHASGPNAQLHVGTNVAKQEKTPDWLNLSQAPNTQSQVGYSQPKTYDHGSSVSTSPSTRFPFNNALGQFGPGANMPYQGEMFTNSNTTGFATPLVDQLGGRPGGGVRDDFSS